MLSLYHFPETGTTYIYFFHSRIIGRYLDKTIRCLMSNTSPPVLSFQMTSCMSKRLTSKTCPPPFVPCAVTRKELNITLPTFLLIPSQRLRWELRVELRLGGSGEERGSAGRKQNVIMYVWLKIGGILSWSGVLVNLIQLTWSQGERKERRRHRNRFSVLVLIKVSSWFFFLVTFVVSVSRDVSAPHSLTPFP